MPVEGHGDVDRRVLFMHDVASLVLERRWVAHGASSTKKEFILLWNKLIGYEEIPELCLSLHT
jgi:hypothetical protein